MFRKNENDNRLEETIAKLLDSMDEHKGDTSEYSMMTEQLTKLYALRKASVSKETWATITAHLSGIAIVVGHERAHVITSKAIQFFTKLR